MSFRKYAALEVLEAWQVPAGPSRRALTKAAHRVAFDYTPRHGYLYVRSRMISSRCNDNHDEFPAGEIVSSYKTFLGKPVFVNHHNANHRRARGVIVAVALHRDRNPDGSPDTWVEGLMEVDALRFPKLAKAILTKRITKTSMGVDVAFSVCSACNNKAESPADYCQHLPAMKGKKIRQRGDDGILREAVIREKCHGLSFFENSLLVEDPADPTAYFLGEVDARGLAKSASRTAAAEDDEPDFRDHIRNHCTSCGNPVHFARGAEVNSRYPWKHQSPSFGDDHPAQPSDPADKRPAESMSYGGTHCLFCGDQTRISLAHLHTPSGGWSHEDGMKRDHLAYPADARAVYDSIPGQKARKDQVRQQVADQLERQGLPRRSPEMPPDPFLASRHTTARRSFDELAPHEQQAASLYHQQMIDDGDAHSSSTPGDYSYELRQEPKGQFLTRYMDAGDDFKREYGPGDWEAHHRETLSAHPIPHYPADNRWPVVVSDSNPDYVDDGYHRMHSYMRDGATEIPTMRMHRTAEVHPGAQCPNCGSQDHLQLHLPIGHGIKVPSNLAACHGCGEVFDGSKSGEQARVDRESAQMALKAHWESAETGDKLYKHITDQPTKDIFGWGGSEEAMRRRTEPEHQNRGPYGVPLDPQASETGRQMYEHKRNRALTHSGEFPVPDLPEGHHLSLLAHFHTAITGEEAEPGRDIFAAPNGRSPVRDHFEQKLDEHLDPRHGDDPRKRPMEDPYLSAPDHGPYHVTRDPENSHPETGTYHLLDAQGRDASRRGGGYRSGMFPGYSGAMSDWHRLTHHEDPDEPRDGGRKRDIIDMSEDHDSRPPPSFPHSRIDPRDAEIATRPDARVHKPEGHSNPDEYHGSYEVVKHPETGKFHVVDNAGRQSGGYNMKFDTQIQAERSRDYVEKRQQSKEKAKGLAEGLWGGVSDILDPGGTKESRESDANLSSGQDLMKRYTGGRGQVKFDSDEEGGRPYYERDHFLPGGKPSGWVARHYGGTHMDLYHRATGDEAHDAVMGLPSDREGNLHKDFDDIELGKHLSAWHDQSDGMRQHLETERPEWGGNARIQRWKRQHQGSLQAEAATPYQDPGDHPFFQENPVSSDNVKSAYYDTLPDERNLGNRWYPDGHHVAKAIAGGDAATGAGLLAAYSPRTSWPTNLLNASHAYRNGAFGGPGTGAMTMHGNLASKILAGEHHSTAFKSPKIKAFAHLLEHGGDAPGDAEEGNQRVVIDRHALSTAVGRRLTDKEIEAAPIDQHRYHEYVGDTYRQAAAELSHELGNTVAPHQIQAAVWKRQQRLNQAEDAKDKGRGTGRNKREENAKGRWSDHAQEHFPEIGEDNMHRQGAQRTAIGETTVPPQIDTLRQEACPVCGESEVWTGQRCPVCGFVAPPDLFRDPDLTKAREMRDQMDQQSPPDQPGQFPQGPADEEAMQQQQGSFPDSDAQMFHPDQITPNGVPVAGQDLRDGEGDLPQGPDDPNDPNAQPDPNDPNAIEQQGLADEQAGETEEEQGEQEAAEGEAEQQEAEDQAAVVLACPACGTQFQPGDQGAAEGQPCPACGQAALAPVDDGEGPEKDQEPQGGKVMAGKASPTVREAFVAQARRVAYLEAENAALRGSMSFLAEVAGVGKEVAAIQREAMRRVADEMNPGQPVPDPPEGPPSETTEQALQPGANGDASRPGTEPGSTEHVPAAATTTAITPGVEIQTPPATNLVDVTAPVQGTNPSQDGGVPLQQRRIETDVRIDPDPLKASGPGIGGAGNNGTAFPWTMAAREGGPAGAEATQANRTFASVRLARLRVTAGLAHGDELSVAAAIEGDPQMPTPMIEHEIGLLSKLGAAAPAARPRQRTAARSGPSLAAPPQAPMAMVGASAHPDSWEDDGDIFLS